MLHWVDSFAVEKLQGIRFMSANPLIARTLTGGPGGPGGNRIGAGLTGVVDELATLLPDPSPENRLLLRMAVLSINAAVQAAATDAGDEAVIRRRQAGRTSRPQRDHPRGCGDVISATSPTCTSVP